MNALKAGQVAIFYKTKFILEHYRVTAPVAVDQGHPAVRFNGENGFDIRKNAKVIPGEFIEDLEVILGDKEMIEQAVEEKVDDSAPDAIEIPETISVINLSKEFDKPVAVLSLPPQTLHPPKRRM